MQPVKTTARGPVTTVTLADVEGRNSLSSALVEGLHEALAAANADPRVRAVVITNEGNTFCAGANLKERPGSTGGHSPRIGFDELLLAIQRSPTPVVARIAGHVVGGGNGLAAACDISIAAEDVRFGFTEVRLGVAPAIISVVCLPKMRRGDALEAFLRGHRFPASRAAELGLITRAVPASQLDACVDAVVADLQKAGPKALAAAKGLVYEVPALAREDAFRWTRQLSAELFRSDEAREGVAAFLGRRRPAWAADEGA